MGLRAAKAMGVARGARKGWGQFGASAAPLIAGSFLQRSENPVLSGVGTAMTFAPMFKGMTGTGKVTSGPLSGKGKVTTPSTPKKIMSPTTKLPSGRTRSGWGGWKGASASI